MNLPSTILQKHPQSGFFTHAVLMEELCWHRVCKAILAEIGSIVFI